MVGFLLHENLTMRKIIIKGELGEFYCRFTLERYPYINKNFWWFRFFLIRLGCREI